jgi:hypothetical protein
VERKRKIEGFRMGVDLILKSRHKPYMISQLFAEYISMVLLPYIDELRSNEEFADKEAVLAHGQLFHSCTGGDVANARRSPGESDHFPSVHNSHISMP